MERIIKPSALEKLKADKDNPDVKINEIKRFYVKVPDVQAHANHPKGDVCGIGLSVHPSIIEKIYELVAAGTVEGKQNDIFC